MKISKQDVDNCSKLAKKLATKKLAIALRELDTEYQDGDAHIKGANIWILLKEILDLPVIEQLSQLEWAEKREVSDAKSK